MKNRKKLMAALLAVSVLAACGQKEEEQVAEPVEQEEVAIDISAEAEQFKAFAIAQMADFVADSELLAQHIRDGKLEEAQKLYPLVTMYYERLQSLAPNFSELDAKINGELEVGKETEATGFQRLAYGLFTEKKTAGYEEVANEFVANIKALQTELDAIDVSENNVLTSAVKMFDEMASNRLTASSIANNEVYAVKAQTEAAEELVKIFMPRVSTEITATTTEAITALNDVVAYYEVGKEDYVNYSYFTTQQKEELKAAVVAVKKALEKMNETLK